MAVSATDAAAIAAAAKRDAARAQGRVLTATQIAVLRRTVFARSAAVERQEVSA
ncbi:hypothetical protein [Mycobacteroides sp. PCS013]|uniref:hypothetical protein n=1 Tax=Mycobacteroides sp. PCS013 TaxID=3074106 RepID=UPI003C2E3EE0